LTTNEIFRLKSEITAVQRIGCQRRPPVELELQGAKTSRGPKHFHRPPRVVTDITQIEKIRQSTFTRRDFAAHEAVALASQQTIGHHGIQELACVQKNL